jgi:hypothetical protein
VLAHALADLCRRIAAECDEPNAPLVEVATKFFPTP